VVDRVRYGLQPSPPDAVLVTDEAGRDVYCLEGPRRGDGRWWLRDLAGRELLAVRQHGSPYLPSFGVYRRGRRVATVRELPPAGVPRAAAAWWNALAGTPRRLRYVIRDERGALRIDADAMALEYAVTRSGRPVATVSVRWFVSQDASGITVAVDDPQDALPLLMAVAVIETSWGRLCRPAPRAARRAMAAP
jgi:uncharacterized protein YxjI